MLRTTIATIALAGLCSAGAIAQQTNQNQPQANQNQQGANQAAENRPEVISRWAYDPLYADGWSARALYADTMVVNPAGNEIGSVENILFSEQGRVLGVVAEVGGFLDIGDTHLYVPWDRVEISPAFDRITVPVTEETAEDYAFVNSTVWRETADQIQRVGELTTGPDVWKVTDIINDYGYTIDGAGYGYIYDLVVSRAGEVKAVVVNADPGYGGYYRALPYRGYTPTTSPYYDLGYRADELQGLDRFDYDQIEGGNAARQSQ